jgi:branched-chain amino acid transport system substrate-binding protein
VQGFVQRFKTRFSREPDAYNVAAYDAMMIAYTVISAAGVDRRAIRDGLEAARDIPSVIFGKATFDPTTRRVNRPHYTRLVVKDGRFIAWDGTLPAS